VTDALLNEISSAGDAAVAQFSAASTLDALRSLGSELLGKKGPLAGFKAELGGLDPDARREAGQAVNAAMTAAQAAFDQRQAVLAATALDQQLLAEKLDLTEITTRPRRGHPHLVTQVWERLEDVFVGLGFTIAEGPEAETDYYNFQALGMGPGHPARSAFDTMFLNYGAPGSTVLRTHTSNVQIRTMENQKPPIYIVAPGRVFRRDTADATHMAAFHQIEGLVVDKGITMAHLKGTIQAFTEAFIGTGVASRLRPSYFPFTEPSAEFDVQRPNGTWMELGGCGMVHPDVLSGCGIDPEEYSGFAFGFGLDRFPIAGYGIDDLRDMYANDIRFVEQF
jgi:phenylalanyl-tRNA synthetase alpha chain